ncbi:MAG TPA: putative ABC exporter domain-containing protein, partial [Gemmatimonadaceae bacterium]|nr:putative ABC exporter domain-containing protein [Gemmatimonadaceae bacterium]
MIDALSYLVARTMRNRIARAIGRLRSPRYAIAMVAGVFYFWALFLRPGHQLTYGTASSTVARLVYELLLGALIASWWIFGSDKPPLHFSPAEVQFLFPAPLTRRQLIIYKLLRIQLVILLSSLIWTVILRRGPAGDWWMRGLALFVLFSTLQLHRIGALLLHSSAARHGRSGLRHALFPLLVAAVAIVVVAMAVARAIPTLGGVAPDAIAGDVATRVADAPAVQWVLWPVRALVEPVFTTSPLAWARAMLPAFALLLIHIPWVLRTDAAFEEAAAEAAAKRAARSDQRRSWRWGPSSGDAARPWFPLAATGAPAIALVWKNVLAFTRPIRPSTVVLIGGAALVVYASVSAAAHSATDALQVLGTITLVAGAVLVMIGPSLVRIDLRVDMLRLELIRTFPLTGADIVSAEVASSTLVLTALQLTALSAAGLIFSFGGNLGELLSVGWPAVVAGIVSLPALNALRLWISNATAVLYPAWAQLGERRATGIEATGQGIVTFLGATLVLLALLFVPAVVTSLLAGVLDASRERWSLLVAVVGGLTV